MAAVDHANIDRLARQAQSGDRRAYSQIVQTMISPLTALTCRMTGDRQSGLDLVQEVFITGWERIHQFRGESHFASWLYRIAVNKSLNYRAGQSGRGEVAVADLAETLASSAIETNPEQHWQQERLRQDFLRFMATLPEQQRAVFELRFYEQLSFPEIAQILDRALGTVKTHYREAVKKLRDWAVQKGWR